MVFFISSILISIKIENQYNVVDKKFNSIVTLIDIMAFQPILTCLKSIKPRAAEWLWE